VVGSKPGENGRCALSTSALVDPSESRFRFTTNVDVLRHRQLRE